MPEIVRCAHCNAENRLGLNFCTCCGSRLSTPCQNCGALVPPDSRFCPNCAALAGIGRFGKFQHKIENTDIAIKCRQCGTENTSGRRFCSNCGSRLVIPCPVCGNVNVLPSGYCPDCGNIVDRNDKH